MNKDYEVLLNKASFTRGAMINDTVFLEKVIDQWLSEYFCQHPKRRSDIFELVFCHDNLGYNSKVQIFCEIIKRHCPEFNSDNPKLKSDLEEIGKHRNRFAHWLLDTKEEQLQSNELRFLRSKDLEDYEHYTNERILSIVERIDYYKFAIASAVQPPVE